MTTVKARFRMARSLEEAAELLFAKQPKKMRNFRSQKKLWEEGVYEDAPDLYEWKKRASQVGRDEVNKVNKRTSNSVTLPTLNWLKKEEQK